jgi:hypothetical protein
MTNGPINSPAQLETARKVFHAFGCDWGAIEEAATIGEDGVYRVRLPRETPADPARKTA